MKYKIELSVSDVRGILIEWARKRSGFAPTDGEFSVDIRDGGAAEVIIDTDPPRYQGRD